VEDNTGEKSMKRAGSVGLLVLLLVSSFMSFEVFLQAKGVEASGIRLLLNFYSGGELLGGAFTRQSFESHFGFVGYYNTRPNITDWKAFDVVCTNLIFSLTQEESTTFRAFLSAGGGLIILRGGTDPILKQIDTSLSNNGSIYNVLGGVVATNVEYMLGVQGVFNSNFEAFLDAVAATGRNKIGDRSITPKVYYGTDVLLQGNRIDMIVEQSRVGAYQNDISVLEKYMTNMENFVGFQINRRVTVAIRPVALEFGAFAFGVSNGYDKVSFCDPPGQLDGIFRHECAHIYEYEFNQRYFFIPSFGVAIIDTAGIDGATFSEYVGLLASQPRAVHLFGALVHEVGASQMSAFFSSLSQYAKNLIPTQSYWDSIYVYPEEETEWLKRSSSAVNFYFSRAYGRNFYSTIKNWGVNEVVDWAPIFSQLNQTEQMYLQNPNVPGASSKRREMWLAFYSGDYQNASALSNELQSIIPEVPSSIIQTTLIIAITLAVVLINKKKQTSW
jgi:hypothetical protein